MKKEIYFLRCVMFQKISLNITKIMAKQPIQLPYRKFINY